MLTVEDALRAVLDHTTPLPSRRVSLAEALGCVLAEEVIADRDLPPFDKALLDGFAVRSADLAGPGSEFFLEVIEEIPAGKTPTRPIGPGQASQIMTGAPMPEGADAVVMVEDSHREGDRVVLRPRKPVTPDAGRLPRGREMSHGDVLLRPGDGLNPVRLGLLASVGWVEPRVHPRPSVAIASTGDEIVPPDQTPGPGQIRNSNASMLDALARSTMAEAEVLPIAPDEPGPLRDVLSRGLRHDVMLITGGVSAGNRDLVPGTLDAIGVRGVFHKVRLKPGKPLWFGVGPDRDGDQPGSLVFGLPGNPVSGVVGFLLFVAPALRALRGLRAGPSPTIPAALDSSFSHRGDRPTYFPSKRVDDGAGGFRIEPLGWAGSADLRTVALSDGFAVFEAGDHDYQAGAVVPFLPIPRID